MTDAEIETLKDDVEKLWKQVNTREDDYRRVRDTWCRAREKLDAALENQRIEVEVQKRLDHALS